MKRFPLFLYTSFTASLWAQGLSLQAPSVGYVYNPSTSAIHSVVGLPGASALSDVVIANIKSGSVSPDGDAAVVATPDGVSFLSGILGGSPQSQPLSASTRFNASWGASSAVVATLDSWCLLSLGPGGWTTNPLSVGLPQGTVRAIDYDPSSSNIYVSVSELGIFKYSVGDGTLSQISPILEVNSLTHVGRRVLASTRDGIFDLDGTSLTMLPSTLAIAGSTDGTRLYAVTEKSVQLTVINLSDLAVSLIPLSAKPKQLERIGKSAFLLSNEINQPLWLLDDSPTPNVFFVPAWKHAPVVAQEVQ